MPPENWQLDQLIGRANEQRWLEELLRQDILGRHGRTVVITGPVGSGRAAPGTPAPAARQSGTPAHY
jgi:hypothetical protein